VTEPEVLHTTIGDLPLEQVQLTIGDRSWSILHTGAVISREEEIAFLRGENTTKRPYGIVLWPAAIALAHEIATRDLAGKRVLELGAGTGLPGVVAASLGARVVQTDRQNIVLHVCKQNAERNGIQVRGVCSAGTIDHRIADWTEWSDDTRYDLIIGSDILYAQPLHTHLRRIFETNLAPGGTLLLADPFRETSFQFLQTLESDGWRARMDKWTVGLAPPPRAVGVVTLQRSA
jgi:methyltransferase-like protein 23